MNIDIDYTLQKELNKYLNPEITLKIYNENIKLINYGYYDNFNYGNQFLNENNLEEIKKLLNDFEINTQKKVLKLLNYFSTSSFFKKIDIQYGFFNCSNFIDFLINEQFLINSIEFYDLNQNKIQNNSDNIFLELENIIKQNNIDLFFKSISFSSKMNTDYSIDLLSKIYEKYIYNNNFRDYKKEENQKFTIRLFQDKKNYYKKGFKDFVNDKELTLVFLSKVLSNLIDRGVDNNEVINLFIENFINKKTKNEKLFIGCYLDDTLYKRCLYSLVEKNLLKFLNQEETNNIIFKNFLKNFDYFEKNKNILFKNILRFKNSFNEDDLNLIFNKIIKWQQKENFLDINNYNILQESGVFSKDITFNEFNTLFNDNYSEFINNYNNLKTKNSIHLEIMCDDSISFDNKPQKKRKM